MVTMSAGCIFHVHIIYYLTNGKRGIKLFYLSDLHKNFLTKSFYGTQHIHKFSYNHPFEVHLVVLLLFFLLWKTYVFIHIYSFILLRYIDVLH